MDDRNCDGCRAGKRACNVTEEGSKAKAKGGCKAATKATQPSSRSKRAAKGKAREEIRAPKKLRHKELMVPAEVGPVAGPSTSPIYLIPEGANDSRTEMGEIIGEIGRDIQYIGIGFIKMASGLQDISEGIHALGERLSGPFTAAFDKYDFE